MENVQVEMGSQTTRIVAGESNMTVLNKEANKSKLHNKYCTVHYYTVRRFISDWYGISRVNMYTVCDVVA